MVIYHIYDFWVYPFLNWDTVKVAAYYVGFTLAAIVLHMIWWGFTLLRNKLSHYTPENAKGDSDEVAMKDTEASRQE